MNSEQAPSLLEVKRTVLAFLTKCNLINPRRDMGQDFFQKIPSDPIGEEAKKSKVSLKEAVLVAACKSLAQDGILTEIQTSAETYWIANVPILTKSQFVEVNFDTALAISLALASFAAREKIEIKTNPLEINSEDLRLLANAVEMLLENDSPNEVSD